MAEKTVTIEPAERTYILPPHPEARTVTNAKTVISGEPTVSEETLTDLVQSAVAGLRGELKAELHQELKLVRGGIENAENQELPIG